MSAAEEPVAAPQVGRFEFRLAISDKEPDGDQRVNALMNWLLAEWERAAEEPDPKPKENLFGRN